MPEVESMKRRIGVFTATRAEYGLLRPVIVALEGSSALEPCVIVSGAHLSPGHGSTLAELEADGVAVAGRLPVWPEGDTPLDAAVALGRTAEGMARLASELKLDALMMLGDRSEALGAAAAAAVLTLPVIHLEGGHLTSGAIDDALRHAITKLSALHFTSHEDYRRRILAMGEAEDRVFTVGPTGAAGLPRAGSATVESVSERLGFDLTPGFLLFTWQPETLTPDPDGSRLDAVLAGLDDRPKIKVLATLPNADAGGRAIRERLARWAETQPRRVVVRESLGRNGYTLAMAAAAAVVGNSSSGLIEAPLVGTTTVNIGDRQGGRRRAASVVDCPVDRDAIAKALDQAVDAGFVQAARDRRDDDPLTDGRAADRIVAILEGQDFTALARKPFVDR